MKVDKKSEVLPEDESAKTIKIPRGVLEWKKEMHQVSTPLGATNALIEILDHAG